LEAAKAFFEQARDVAEQVLSGFRSERQIQLRDV
jgi:hypothetical protein